MEKKYTRVEFGIDDKEPEFSYKEEEHGRFYTKIKINFHCPDKFVYKEEWKIDNDELHLFIKGGKPEDSIESLNEASCGENFYNINEKVNGEIPVVNKLNIIFHWNEYDNGDSGFMPETAGGGILVGTGG